MGGKPSVNEEEISSKTKPFWRGKGEIGGYPGHFMSTFIFSFATDESL